MKHGEFISKLDDERIVAAIGAAEKKTSGQIRVFVSRRSYPNPLAAAEKHFKALGMQRTKQHNGVLIFFAPKSQTFAIYGDTAVHEKCGEGFWSALRDQMAEQLKESRYTDALVRAIDRAGELLAEHFPAAAGGTAAGDNLPDAIARD